MITNTVLEIKVQTADLLNEISAYYGRFGSKLTHKIEQVMFFFRYVTIYYLYLHDLYEMKYYSTCKNKIKNLPFNRKQISIL